MGQAKVETMALGPCCRKTGFGHFLEFGTWDDPDIAYCDWAKCFSTFGHGEGSCIINEACIINVIYAKKG